MFGSRALLVVLAAVAGCAPAAEAPDAAPPDAASPADLSAAPVCTTDGLAGLPAAVTAGADGQSWTLACGGRTLTVSIVADGTVRLRHTDGLPAARRSWAVIAPPDVVALEAGHAPDGALLVCTARLLLTIGADCRIHLADAAGHPLVDDAAAPSPAALDRALDAGEHLYGLGSQTGALDRRGRRFTLWSTDPYDAAHGGFPPDAPTLYPSIPFLVGLRHGVAWGALVDDSHRLDFDLGATDPLRWRVATAGAELDEYLFVGPRMADVLTGYTRLTGKPALPPRWALGFHQSRWGWFPDTQVKSIAATFRARELPADGLWLDIQHMDGFRSFTWDPQGFPDPAGLISSLANDGFKTTLIVDPGIKRDPAWDVYQAGLAQNAYLANGGDGTPYVGNAWPGEVVFPDFSAPSTRAWWAGLMARPVGLGARGLWIDMNEPTNLSPPAVPDTLAAAGDGQPTTMAELHNAYALLEAQATYDGMRAGAPDRRPLIISRAGFAGLQRYAGLWTGDAPSDFATLGETLAMMMGISLSGVPLVGSDVGGYSGHATPELYARWMELGALSPFFRAHVTSGVPSQEPWQFGFEVEDVSRTMLRERYELLPYLYSLFATGEPLVRPLVYEFPDDEPAATLGDQAMLGPFLLYAPIVTAGATRRSVHLPPGRWYDPRSGRAFDGGQTVDRAVTLAELPLFVREGAIVPHGPAMQYSDQAPLDPLTLDVWPADAPSTFTLFEDAGDGFGGDAHVTYTLAGDVGGATLVAGPRTGSWVPPPRTLVVRLHPAAAAPTAVTLDGQPIASVWDANDATLEVRFPDRAGFTLAAHWDRTVPVPPTVDVPLHPTLPAGTTGSIYVATSAGGWAQQPLGAAKVTVPRGEWFFYKYTRGDWSTVEKDGACQELANRYAYGAAHPGKSDVVAAWGDTCH